MSRLPKALLIEDDPVTTLLIKESLSPLISVVTYLSGKEGIEGLDSEAPDIILLDLNLPDANGIQLLQAIRRSSNHKHTPVLIITASDSQLDEFQGHEFGVTEYLKKPIDPKLIKIVVEKNIAKSIMASASSLSFEGIEVDLNSMSASVENKQVDLTTKELKILIYMLENKERVLSKEQIFEKIWKDNSDSLLRTVEMHISSLRKKLGVKSDLLKTIRGLGYTLKK
ncbi:MAG: DNA-binding response OmpR family regulator [Bacteriovoracaceae bacterium]|jgi:DNA-binding response OmpR family regulator